MNEFITNCFDDLYVIDNHIVDKDYYEKHSYRCAVCGERHSNKEKFMKIGEEAYICVSCIERYGIVFYTCCHCLTRMYNVLHPSFEVFVALNSIKGLKKRSARKHICCTECEHLFCSCYGCNNRHEKHSDKCEYHNAEAKLKPYAYSPEEFRFYKGLKDTDNIYIGIEFEINFEKGKDKIDFLKNIKSDFFYFKHDGSLDKHGIEIVSHPATIKYHLYSDEWKKLFEELNKYEVNTKGCGIHFHISREVLGENVVKQIDFFVNNYKNVITEIGSRTYNRFSQHCKKFERSYSHYDACNLCNTSTVELRFCASTHNYKSFIKKLKAIYIIIGFCSNFKFDNVRYDAFNYYKGEILSRI